MTPNLKPLVTLRVKDGQVEVSHLAEPKEPNYGDCEMYSSDLDVTAEEMYKSYMKVWTKEMEEFENSFVIVADCSNDVLKTISKVQGISVGEGSEQELKIAKRLWIDGDYDVSKMGMVFSVEEVPEFPGFDHTSYPTFKNVAICSLPEKKHDSAGYESLLMPIGEPEKKEVGSDETDFGVLCANLLMFAEADGTIVNGYRSKEIVQQIRKTLKH